MSKRYLVFISDAASTCGVEEFARLLAQRLPGAAHTRVLGAGPGALLAAMKGADSVILNFPVVGWKRKLVSPLFSALAARIFKRDVIVILHEWAALDWKRRVILAPVLLLASRICFSAPEIAAEFGATKLSRLATSKRSAIPIPPNLIPPTELHATVHSDAIRKQRESGRLILGQFGSIYPMKQSTAVLHVAADLIARGHDVGLVFAGSFIKGMDNVEQQFFDLARSLGLIDRLLVTGYIPNADALFALLAQVDVFCYLFPEGLTSRRASVLAAALSGKPVVVNAPARDDALRHHGLYLTLIRAGIVRLVETDAEIAIVADAVIEAAGHSVQTLDVHAEIEAVWHSVVDTISREAP